MYIHRDSTFRRLLCLPFEVPSNVKCDELESSHTFTLLNGRTRSSVTAPTGSGSGIRVGANPVYCLPHPRMH
jgi:hypothetical protein